MSTPGYDGDQTRELIEHSHLLNELTRQPGWLVLTKLAGQSIDAYQKRLSSGRLDDLHEYKFLAGWLDGARQILAIPAVIAERLAREQEQAREAAEQADLETELQPEYAARA